MKALSNKCSLILEGKEYTIDRLLIANDNRHIYLGHIENNNSNKYSIIKEIFSDCSGIIPLKRDSFTQQLIIDNEKLQQLHINQSEIVVEDLCEHELRINSIVFSEQDKETNSAYFFNFERKQSICNRVAYYVIDTVEGYTLDQLYDHLHKKDNINDADELVRIAVEKTKLATEALGRLHQKGVLHLDIKPSNVYSVGGFDSEIMHIKLLDLGSAILLSELGGAEFSGSTNGYCSPLMRRLQDPDIQSNRKAANELIGKLDFRDDIFGLARVLIFLLTGTTKEEDLNNLECNRYYKSLLQKIVRRASEGKTIRYESNDRNCGDYRSCEDFIQDLNELSDALNNKGLSETIMLKKGREYFDGRQLRKRKIDENLIPILRAEDEEGNCFATVTELCEELKAKKQNIFIHSQGGAGKSFMLYQSFLYFSNHEKIDYIPLYIPLKDVFEDKKGDVDNENPVYKYILKHYTGENDVSTIGDFLGKSKAKYLVLADGLNEIPRDRQIVIDNLKALSDNNNISVIVTSRYREIQFAGFSQYELADLDERIIRSKVNNYDSLSNELKELLGTPFNLCIYIGLSEESKKLTLKTASDLVQVNIDELNQKLVRLGYSQTNVDLILGYYIPLLAYKMCQEKVMSFSEQYFRKAVVNFALHYTEMVNYYENYDSVLKGGDLFYDGFVAEMHAWSDKYKEFCEAIIVNPTKEIKCIRTTLAENGLFFQSGSIYYSISHEIFRDFLGACGWRYIAESFKMLYQKNGDNLSVDIFRAPICIHSYLKEIVKRDVKTIEREELNSKEETAPRNYFDYLFNISTRSLLHNKAAAEFNKCIIEIIKSLCMDGERHSIRQSFPIVKQQDFSRLDLSLTAFVGLSLESCDFSNSIMREDAFSSVCISDTPDEVWSDDEIIVLLYKVGLIRCVSIEKGLLYERKTKEFDTGCVYENKIIITLRNCTPDEKEKDEVSNVRLFCIDAYCVNNGERLPVAIVSTHQSVFRYNNILMHHISEIFVDADGYMHCLFDAAGSPGIITYHIRQTNEKLFFEFCNIYYFEYFDRKLNDFTFSLKASEPIFGQRCIFTNTNKDYRTNYLILNQTNRFNERYFNILELNIKNSDQTYVLDGVYLYGFYEKFFEEYPYLKSKINNSIQPYVLHGPYPYSFFGKFSDGGYLLGVRIIDGILVATFLCCRSIMVKYFDFDLNEIDNCFDGQDLLFNITGYVETDYIRDPKQYNKVLICNEDFLISDYHEICRDVDNRRIKPFEKHISDNYSYIAVRGEKVVAYQSEKNIIVCSDGEVTVWRNWQEGKKLYLYRKFSFVSSYVFIGRQISNNNMSLITKTEELYPRKMWDRNYSIFNRRFVRRDTVSEKDNPFVSQFKGITEYEKSKEYFFEADYDAEYFFSRILGYVEDSEYNVIDEILLDPLSRMRIIYIKYGNVCKRIMSEFGFNDYNIRSITCIHHRFIIVSGYGVVGEEPWYADIIPTPLVVLDVSTDRVINIEIDKRFHFINSSEPMFETTELPIGGINIPELSCNEDVIEKVLLISKRRIFELRVDLNKAYAEIVYQTEFFPDVWIERCSFKNVDVIVDDDVHEEELRGEMKKEDIRIHILQTWEENNLN